LLLAAASGNELLVQRLLDAGAAVDQADTEGNTPLMMAAANGHPGLVRLLLLSGANPHAKNRNGRTALTWAYAPAPALFHDVGALREVVTLLRSHDRGSRQ
jgi:ankyrin repeat protein